MNYGMNVRPERIDSAVHRELGRGAALIAAKLVAVDVNQHEHVFGHPAFAHHRRRREDVAVVKPSADVAIGSRNKAELVDAAAYLNDLLSEFALSLHSLTVIKQKVIGMFAFLSQSHCCRLRLKVSRATRQAVKRARRAVLSKFLLLRLDRQMTNRQAAKNAKILRGFPW